MTFHPTIEAAHQAVTQAAATATSPAEMLAVFGLAVAISFVGAGVLTSVLFP